MAGRAKAGLQTPNCGFVGRNPAKSSESVGIF
jgi:hypothetical protein